MTKYFVKVSSKTGKTKSAIIEIDKKEFEITADDITNTINSVFKGFETVETINKL